MATTAKRRKLRVLFASSEAVPFAKTGGLGDVAGSLPAALAAAGAEVNVMVPKYATIADEYKNQMEHVGEFYVPLGWRNEYCGLERLVYDGVTYMFLDNEHYFSRSYPYGFFDDGERFAFFSKAICESLQYLPDGFVTDVLHCNDWHTALAPVFLREFYMANPLYQNVKTVFSIHNIAFQGQFTDMLLGDVLGLSHIEPAVRQLRCDARSINYMQGALNYTDAITTVSPTYADELQYSFYAHGLEGVIADNRHKLRGILNGIDTEVYDPWRDKGLTKFFSARQMAGKKNCKAALQQMSGLRENPDAPIIACVSRLVRHKGFDLVTAAIHEIMGMDVQMIVLGTGDWNYEEAFRQAQNQYPGRFAAHMMYSPNLSTAIYGGADLFLMPSISEPCGLSQMIAMRYGTIPVVRETGGLRDSVVPYNKFTGEGTGFSFANINVQEMTGVLSEAVNLYHNEPKAWKALQKNAMTADFSWEKSAKAYEEIYGWVTGK